MNRTLVRDVSRRRFLAGLGPAALRVPAILKSAERLNREATPTKIGIEEHWSTKEVDEQYPFVDQEAAVEIFERTPMSDETRQMISHRNAERWLGLPA